MLKYIHSRVRKQSPNMTPPMTPARVARVNALPLRQLFTFSWVNLAMVWPLLLHLASRPHFRLGGRVLVRQHLKYKKITALNSMNKCKITLGGTYLGIVVRVYVSIYLHTTKVGTYFKSSTYVSRISTNSKIKLRCTDFFSSANVHFVL